MKNRFDLIIFDWDGTLADSVDWIVASLQYAARQQNQPVPEPQAAKNIIGLSIEKATQTLFPDADQQTRHKLASDYSAHFFSRQPGPADLFPGVHGLLQSLKDNGYRLAVATGKKASGLQQIMTATGVDDLFCTTRSADQTASKPHPLMLEEIMTELNISKQRTLVVGDSIHDLQMALNAGVAAIGVTCGAHSASELQAFKPLLCLQQTSDLFSLLQRT